jgi:hypothetical protein
VKSYKTAAHLFGALGLIFLAVPEEARAGEEHVLLLIDRSGSMLQIRSDGTTRYAAAIDRALKEVRLPSPNNTRHFAVWSFEGSSYFEHQPFTPNADTAIAALNNLAGPGGGTPLAYASCAAVDRLMLYRPQVFARKKLRLSSDGEENSSPSTSECAGNPSAGVYPNLTAQSWQWKVLNKLRTGNPQNPNDPGTFALIADIDYFTTLISPLNGVVPGIPEYSESGEWLAPASPGPTVSDPFKEFLKGIAAETGGRFIQAADSSPPPVYGDTNQSGCVDNVDYNLVLANFGFSVPPGDPAADVNSDGVVDYNDYAVVMSNWGMGGSCAAPLNGRE